MQANNTTPENHNYQFLCERTKLPQEYLNLDKFAPLEDKILCQKCAEKYLGKSCLIPIKEFVQKSRRAFLTEKYLDLELLRKELKHLNEYYRLKFDHYRVAFIESFMKISQRVEKLIDTRIGTMFHIAKENYLEKLSLFDNPHPSYDLHSLTSSLLKVLGIQEEREGFTFEVKLTSEIKEELKRLQQDTKTELEPYEAMFNQLDHILTQLKDPSTFEYHGISITKWNFKTREIAPRDSIENSIPVEPYTYKPIISTPSSRGHKKEIDFQSTSRSTSSRGKTDDSIQEVYQKAFTTTNGITINSTSHHKKEHANEIMIQKVNEMALLKEMNLIKHLNLNLSGHQINSNNCYDVAAAIKFQKDLEVLKLDLSNNSPQMTRDAFREILSAITHLHSLRRLSLNLRINNFTPLEMTAISSFYTKMDHITELDLLCSFNLIGDDGVATFAKVLGKHVKLKKLKLDLQKTKVGSSGFRVLFENLANLKNLEYLSLVISDNKITDQDIEVLADTLKVLSELVTLDIHSASNLLKDEALSAFAGALFNGLENLKNFGLDLQFNDIGYNGVKDIVVAIKDKKTLEKSAINLLDNKDLGSIRLGEVRGIIDSTTHCILKVKL